MTLIYIYPFFDSILHSRIILKLVIIFYHSSLTQFHVPLMDPHSRVQHAHSARLF